MNTTDNKQTPPAFLKLVNDQIEAYPMTESIRMGWRGILEEFAVFGYTYGAASYKQGTTEGVQPRYTNKQLEDMLEDVVNELDLSDWMIEPHGPLGTPPAELVRVVMERKDQQIRMLKAGFKDASLPTSEQEPAGQQGVNGKDQNAILNLAYGVVLSKVDKLFPATKAANEAVSEGWISVEDRPLFTKDGEYWQATDDGSKEFLAAVPYSDKRDGKDHWWIRHCILTEESCLCVVTDDNNEPAGWAIDDVTHWMSLPNPPAATTPKEKTPEQKGE